MTSLGFVRTGGTRVRGGGRGTHAIVEAELGIIVIENYNYNYVIKNCN